MGGYATIINDFPNHALLRPVNSNTLRIIGGRHRSRKIKFPDVADLRPTGDRIRETLFNWLAGAVPDARCLDLFAGSGALGLEALSRGARHVTFVEQSPVACQALRQNAKLLDQENLSVLCAEAMSILGSFNEPFDIVFLDPPFSYNSLSNLCRALDATTALQPDALIYLEQARNAEPVDLPDHWGQIKESHSGNVRYQLYRRL